jgi:hypothetical protein
MEMDLIDRLTVHVALSLGDLLIYCQNIQRHRSRKLHVIAHDMLDIMHAAVVVMAVLMLMCMFMRSIMVMLMIMMMFMLVALIMLVVVMVVMLVLLIMLMIVRVLVIASAAFFFTVDEDRHVCAGDAAFNGRFRHILHARDAARIQFLEKCFLFFFRKKLEKRCAQHIARGAHGTVDVKSLHDFASIWLIILA